MKKIICFVCLVFMELNLVNIVSAQERINKYKNHPYLYFTDERIRETKLKIRQDTIAQHAWDKMLTDANKAVASGKGGDLDALSLIYRMTGDKKYAQQAKNLLTAMLSKSAWETLEDRTPKWNAALGTARNNALTANTYDAIYDMLTDKERKEFAHRIVELGIKPSLDDWTSFDKRLHTLNSMGHNWWSSIVFQAGVASLAVMTEVPEAKKWAEEVMDDANEWFAFSGSVLENKPASFDPQGGFYESINYANFGVGEYLFFRLAWTNAVEKITCSYDDLLRRTGNWFVQMAYPAENELMSVNFGDGGLHVNGERVVKLLDALELGNKNDDWYLSQTHKTNFKENLSFNMPLGLVYSPSLSQKMSLPNLPLSKLYSTMGWASLRDSWKDNSTMLAVKSGFTWNHAHADAGSFILFHNGKNLIIDSGNVNYGNPLYSDYCVRSEAHNVTLFNGKAQDPQDEYYGVKTPGQLYNLMDNGFYKYILADATGPTSRYFLRNYRNVLWVGNVILIIDDLKGYENGRFEWLLHTSVDAKQRGIDLDVTDGNASVLIRPLFPETLPNGYPHDFPEKMKLDVKDGVKDHEPDVKQNYYSIVAPEEVQQTKFVNAIILLDDKNKSIDNRNSEMSSAKEMRNNLPKIEKLEGVNMIGVRITQNGEVTDLYMNLMADGRIMHRNSYNIFDGWETDAYMLAFTYKEGSSSDKFNKLFVANGSFVRKPNNVVLSNLSKVFMTADIKNSSADVLLQGQPLIKAHLNLGKTISKLSVNNQSTPVVRDGNGSLLVRLSSDKSN